MTLFFHILIALKFSLGCIAMLYGMAINDINVVIFGFGHAFILSPLWLWSESTPAAH